MLFAAWGRFVNPDRFGLGFAASTVVYVLLGGRTTLLGGFVGALIIGYLTGYLAEVMPFGTIPGDVTPWRAFLMEATRRIVREAPLLVQGVIRWAPAPAQGQGTPPLFRLLQRHRRWAWWLLLPAVILYLGHRVACQQTDLCLF